MLSRWSSIISQLDFTTIYCSMMMEATQYSKKRKFIGEMALLCKWRWGKGESHHIKSEVCILGVTYCSHPLELEASTTQLALSTVGSLSFLTYFSGLKVLSHHQIHMRDNTTMDQTQLNANREMKYF